MTAVMMLMLSAVSMIGCTQSDSKHTAAPVDSAAVPPGASTAAATPKGSSRVSGVSSTPERRRRLIIVGTSLTAGLGLNPDVAYPALLQQKIDSAGWPITIVAAGLSGETSAGALRRAAWVLDQPADVVVLEVGANDGLRGVDPDSTKANLVALIEAVRQARPEARVVLVQMEAPTNLGKTYTTRFHRIYGEVARETKTPLLPFLLDGVAGVVRLNQADGIHPNAEGSVLVANGMWKSLAPILSEFAH